MGGGSHPTSTAPFPADPVDPLDPLDPPECSKNGVFIERVAILGLDGVLA